MKLNWKALIASVVVVGVIYWAISSILPRSYSGTNLTFAVGGGAVTVTNPLAEAIPAQFVGASSRSFSVASSIEGLSGASVRNSSGTNRDYVFDFELPTGVSEFTITRGTDVKFVATTAARLEATVNPLSADAARTTLIVMVVIVLGSLFYISRTMEHGWIKRLRGQEVSVQAAKPIPASGGQGQSIRAYGDNRAER